MRIAEISTLHRPVPPVGEGSIESLVSTLTEGLVERGHEVTLFASADSETNARLWSPVPLERHRNPDAWDWQVYEAFQVREAFRMWEEFDLIHCHSYHFGLLYCDLVPTPSLHSVHIEPGPDYRFLAESTTNRSLHFCSRFQAREFERVEGIEVIPHG
ncbi:MAG: glycosyltransferase, partial [Candidatus Omnitrophica bacterium]|nr:glycosyltransferase [Candidatus Omnitrophota bacterium]